jgi:formylglycine-generating enzyme required for sulfatase activity
MGSPTEEVGRSSDEKLHRVQITRGFWIGATPVTQAQWRAVLGADPSDFKGDDRPVENVTWDDCQEFCRVLQERTGRPYRLLTEAEWEYAARAGTTTPYFWGGHLTTDLANFNGAGNSYGGVSSGNLCRWTTTPVRMFFPNLWGLYDIHGNVWEWCEDWHAPYRARARVDPTGPETGQSRVLRGGSWLSPPTTCRTADRNRLTPENRNPYWGVRIAISGRPRQTESAEVFRDSVQKSRMGVTATRPEKHTSTSDPAERLRE